MSDRITSASAPAPLSAEGAQQSIAAEDQNLPSSKSSTAPTDSSSGVPAATGLSLRETISFSLAHSFLSVLLFCVSLKGLYALGRGFGTLEWMVNFKRRRRFAKVLKVVLGEKYSPSLRRRWTRDYFMRSRCDKMFYLIIDRLDRKKAESLFTITNRDMLDEILARGKGVHLAMSHHGPHHVAGMLLALCGYKAAAVRDRKEGGLRKYVQNRFDKLYPEFTRLRVLFADSYPREIYRCFQEGYIVGSAMDVSRVRMSHQKSESFMIFGQPRPIVSGPFHIAYRRGAPVVQAFMIPEDGFRYRFELVEVLLDPTNDSHTALVSKDKIFSDASKSSAADTPEDAAVRRAMTRYAANIEKYVRQTPSLITRL